MGIPCGLNFSMHFWCADSKYNVKIIQYDNSIHYQHLYCISTLDLEYLMSFDRVNFGYAKSIQIRVHKNDFLTATMPESYLIKNSTQISIQRVYNGYNMSI